MGPSAPGRVCLRYGTPVLAEMVTAATMITIATMPEKAKPIRRKLTGSAIAVVLWESAVLVGKATALPNFRSLRPSSAAMGGGAPLRPDHAGRCAHLKDAR